MILLLSFKFSECKQELECKILLSPGAGVGVTFFGAGAVVKETDCDHLWYVQPVSVTKRNQQFKRQQSKLNIQLIVS